MQVKTYANQTQANKKAEWLKSNGYYCGISMKHPFIITLKANQQLQKSHLPNVIGLVLPIAVVTKRYRCGWCGHPCQENGEPLNAEIYNKWTAEESDSTILIDGNGCCDPNGETQRMRVTRDMAIDAGDPSLEGEYI